MWRIWQQALRLTSGAIICSVVCFVPYAARSQDVLIIPESGQQQTGTAAPEPTASPPPSANETSAALPPDIGDLLYPQPQQPTGEKRYVTPVPPTTAVAGLPMYQKQLEMRAPEERSLPQEEKAIPQDRVVPGFTSPLKAKSATLKLEDEEIDTIISAFSGLENNVDVRKRLHEALHEFTKNYPESAWNESIISNLDSLGR